MHYNLVRTTLGIAAGTSSGVAAYLEAASPSLPEAPPVSDPLTWLFLVVVIVVVMGAVWVVKFTLTNGMKQMRDFSEALASLDQQSSERERELREMLRDHMIDREPKRSGERER